MKRAYVEITNELLADLLDIRADIEVVAVEGLRPSFGGIVRVHLRGAGLPDFTDCQELEHARRIDDFEDIQ